MAEIRKRRYEDGCAFAQSLDLIGERWAMLVMRELMFGAARFSDLRAALPGIAPTVLTQRLADLTRAGILVKKTLPPPASGQVYELTPWGRDFREVIRVMGAWASRSPHLHVGWPLTVPAALLSLESMFVPDRAGVQYLRLGLDLSGRPFTAQVLSGALTIRPGLPEEPDCTVTGDPNALLQVIYAGQSVADAVAAGGLSVEGDPDALTRFAAMFREPFPVPAPAP